MSQYEDIFLTKYFVEPGVAGKIGSVHVDDGDLADILGADDLIDLQEKFLRTLPHKATLKAYLAGELTPLAGRPPNYLPILLFVCWMQTSKTRQREDRDFRQMLGRRTGENFIGANMSGLNPMWEHLRDYLSSKHGIELDLPAIEPHRRIGRTLRIAFPTWRDVAVFRKLRQSLKQAQLLDPLVVSNALQTSRVYLTDALPSFAYNLGLFETSRKRGGEDYLLTSFWKAWYSVVAEQAAAEEMEVLTGDFGDFEICRVSPSGERIPIRTPEEACKYVPPALAKAIRNGLVLMEDVGFGRARATTSQKSHLILLRRSKLAECSDGAIATCASVGTHWVLATFRNGLLSQPARSALQGIGWRDGVKVGGGFLGRSPFTPVYTTPQHARVIVSINGREQPMAQVPPGIAFPPGTYSGTAVAQFNAERHSVFLVPCASEIGETHRLKLDRFRDIPEDQFYYGTSPTTDFVTRFWSGNRAETNDAMMSIAEALYARSARGLALVEGLVLIRRGLSHIERRPHEWDVLRAFADAGWFDLTLLRTFPARRLLQRAVTARAAGDRTVLISGPTPYATVERIKAAAETIGAFIEVHHAISEWSLPRYLVRVADKAQQQVFIGRIRFPEALPTIQAEPKQGNPNGIHGYRSIARFDDSNGFFNPSDEVAEGLFRLERNEGKRPFLYRSIVAGQPSESFESPSIAILRHYARTRRSIFTFDGKVLTATAARASLPSSWAHWASDRVICNPGPIYASGKWTYGYPLGQEEVEALSRLVAIEWQRSPLGSAWIERFTSSASNRHRTVYDCRSGKIRGSSRSTPRGP
ncbi:hypothetical protein [Oryzibacter oryziterrae]|uniref:hypothetical protein n=1 Tax=Oryzibacter oryziterrae TaxID=2766474 RepID=UPI001F1FB43A|nr:hypothetical protein [Oryzibacter oryziterrae]